MNAYTSTTALVNDEQLDLEFLLSEVEIEIEPGALVEMKLVFLSERYEPSDISEVRFILEKSFSFDDDTSFDFTIPLN